MFHTNVATVKTIANELGLAEARVTDIHNDGFRKHVGVLWCTKEFNVVLFLQFARIDVDGKDQHAGVVHEGDFVNVDRRLDAFSGDSATYLDELAVKRFETKGTVFSMN